MSERQGARRSVESESGMKVKEVKDMKNVVSWISQPKRSTNLWAFWNCWAAADIMMMWIRVGLSKRVVCGASWKRRSDINVRKLGVG